MKKHHFILNDMLTITGALSCWEKALKETVDDDGGARLHCWAPLPFHSICYTKHVGWNLHCHVWSSSAPSAQHAYCNTFFGMQDNHTMNYFKFKKSEAYAFPKTLIKLHSWPTENFVHQRAAEPIAENRVAATLRRALHLIYTSIESIYAKTEG